MCVFNTDIAGRPFCSVYVVYYTVYVARGKGVGKPVIKYALPALIFGAAAILILIGVGIGIAVA